MTSGVKNQGQETSRWSNAGAGGGPVCSAVVANSHIPSRLLLQRVADWSGVPGSYCTLQLSGVLQLVCQPDHLQPRVQGVP